MISLTVSEWWCLPQMSPIIYRWMPLLWENSLCHCQPVELPSTHARLDKKSIIKIKKGLTDGYLLDLRKLKLWNIKGGLDRQNVFYFNFRRSWFLLLTLKFIICSLYLQSADFNIPRSIEYTMHSKKPQFVFLGQFFWLFQVKDWRYKHLYKNLW